MRLRSGVISRQTTTNSAAAGARISISNNLFLDIVANDPSNIPYFVQTNGGQNFRVEHNTVQQAGNIITGYGSPTRNFIFRDNIVQFNQYGIVCLIDAGECGRENMFCNCFPGGMLRGNVIADNLGAAAGTNVQERYPQGNYFVSSFQKIGLTIRVRAFGVLEPNSRTRNRASDGSTRERT